MCQQIATECTCVTVDVVSVVTVKLPHVLTPHSIFLFFFLFGHQLVGLRSTSMTDFAKSGA